MRLNNCRCTLVVVILFTCGGAALAEEQEPEFPWSVTLFGGVHDDSRFAEMITFRDGANFTDSYIVGAALNRHFGTWWDYLHWEADSSVYRHWGEQHLWEANIALVSRWTRFPWDRHLDTSVAIGSGVSWATRRPPLEGETRQFLHHLLAEIETKPLRDPRLGVVLRVHHRSGVFGLYGARGGSNFLTLGLRYRF